MGSIVGPLKLSWECIMISKTSFYSEEELQDLGLRSLGRNVKISRFCRIYSPELMAIGDDVRVDDYSILSGKIILGDHVHIAAYVGMFGSAGIRCEEFSGISAGCMVYSVTDDYSGGYLTNPTVPLEYKHIISGEVVLKKHSLVGAGSIVLPNVTLGEGSAVGAGSLVNKSLEDWKIYVGVPCRYLKDRKKDILRLESELREAEHRSESI